MIDLRPTNCRFRLQDEGKPFPRSSCTACKKTIVSGLGKECSFPNGRTPRYRMEISGEAGDLYIDHVEDENGAWVMFDALSTARAEGRREGLEEAAKVVNNVEITVPLLVGTACGASAAQTQVAAAIRAKIEEVKG